MHRFAQALFTLTLLVGPGFAQSASGDLPPCPAEPASLKPTEPDIFNDQQEQWLGDALAEVTERGIKFAPPVENAYLQALGERMLSVLPPTGTHYQFRVYESGELNSFGIGGGRIYISRKIVAALRNEDELAGLLAHEIGHNLAHQEAIELTAMFREFLGVTSVGDRADIFAKVHALDQVKEKHIHWHPPSEEHNQDVADEVAIYAMMRAGYQPRAYAAAFDRITANHGKTGNFFTDTLFGQSTEAQRRYRTDLKMAASIPDRCMAARPADTAAFAAWQKLLAERSVQAEDTKEAQQILPLQEPLKADLRSIRYSPNGAYLLAQDASTVFVLQRKPLKVMFTIPIEGSMLPHFTPDSATVVFVTSSLRVEYWDVATQKRTYVKEMVLPEGCDSQFLSPDGKVLACQRIYFDRDDYPALSVALWNVDTNQTVYDKHDFVKTGPGGFPQVSYLYNAKYSDQEPAVDAFSPDSRYYLVALFGQQALIDVATGRKVNMEHGVSEVRGLPFIFASNDRLLVHGQDRLNWQLVSFPEGKLLKALPIGNQANVDWVTRGNYAVVRPIKDNPDGILDLETGKLVAASKYPAADVFDGELATQTPRGGVQLNALGDGKAITSVELPQSLLSGVVDARFTPDGKYLAVSNRARSALWNLNSGKRMGVFRPFGRLSVLPGDVLYFDFNKLDDKPRMQATMDLATGKPGAATVTLPEKDSELLGDMFMVHAPDKPDKPDERVTYQFYDLATGKLAWSRRFVHGVPSIYRDSFSDRIGMWWEMSDAKQREEIDADPVLKQAIASVSKDKDGMVLQLVNSKDGTVQQTIAVKEHKPKHQRDRRQLFVFGDFLLVQGEDRNAVLYRLSDKARIGEVFGEAIAGDVSSGILALSNRRNEVFLLDAGSAKELARYTLAGDIRLASFVAGHKQLLVLTAEQKVYTFDTHALGSDAAQP